DYDPQKLVGRSAKDKAYQRMLKAEELRESQKGYKHWLKNSRMMNKATIGRYAPGSTFKVLTSVGLLEDGVVGTTDTIDEPDSGWVFGRNGQKLARTNHGAGNNVNIYDALEKSSNGYFYVFSQEFASKTSDSMLQLQSWAETFGVGRYLNSDFSMLHAQFPRRSSPGDVAQFAIGQGEFTCTPMELARMYVAVANRGTLYPPRLSTDWRTWPETMDVSAETWDIVHEGMRRVVFGDHGTARKHEILRDIKCAGKTGTAQNGLTTPDHAWFAGFAPHDKPKVAFVMLASYSDLYGADVSPVIAECIQRYLERTK
ncbi:MAG: penicillin-binding transpeptidase domain-containing protein, partial [Planctomycetota bacterium]